VRELIYKFKHAYAELYENKKKLRTILIVIFVVLSIVNLINAVSYYDGSYLIRKEFILALEFGSVILVIKLFHFLFGKWYLHEVARQRSEIVIKEKFPRKFKIDGYTGAGKDSSYNAIRKYFQEDILDFVHDEMSKIETICYIYDFNLIREKIDETFEVYYTPSRRKFFRSFIELMKVNHCFFKSYYLNKINEEEHIESIYQVLKNPYDEEISEIDYVFFDGIKSTHFASMVIKYVQYYVHEEYMKNYLITNQPVMEKQGLTAKEFDTEITEIRANQNLFPFPSDRLVMFWQTEIDSINPNVGKTKSAMTTGLRDYIAFFRHFFGAKSVWVTIGQRGSRTEKALRELDHAFVTIIEQSTIHGGEKRIWFRTKAISFNEFRIKYSLRNKTKEKHYRKRALNIMRIIRLQNKGYIYADIKVSRTDTPTLATQMTTKQIMNYDKQIFESYTVKLCFTIYDCYWGYNTGYLESVAEEKASKSTMNFPDLMNWNSSLVMTRKDIKNMKYDSFDRIVGIDRSKDKKKGGKQNGKEEKN